MDKRFYGHLGVSDSCQEVILRELFAQFQQRPHIILPKKGPIHMLPVNRFMISGLQKGLAERGHVKKRQKSSKSVKKFFDTFRQLPRRAKNVKNRQKVSKSFSTLFDNFRAKLGWGRGRGIPTGRAAPPPLWPREYHDPPPPPPGPREYHDPPPSPPNLCHPEWGGGCRCIPVAVGNICPWEYHDPGPRL